MKKRRIKKSVKILLFVLIICLVLVLSFVKKEDNKKIDETVLEKKEDINYKDYIISKLSN